MAPINWEEARHRYEDMVAVLLSNLYPNSQRIDGSGGDGGRDVQIRTDDALDLFELKSFTGRLGREGDRRRQVEKSLKKAAEHEPDSWSLVVPIDPNPKELEWFDKLRSQYGFPLFWRGKTWLEDQLSDKPRIARYFLEDGAKEAIRLVREISEEKEVVGRGLVEVRERLTRLAEKFDEIDPYYRVDFSVADGLTTLEIVPRYRGAENERPMFLTGRVVLPPNELGRDVAKGLVAALKYGDEASIPAEFTGELSSDDDFGLSEIIAGAPVTIMAADEEDISFSGRLHLYSPQGEALSSMPIRFSKRRKGLEGARLYGKDPTNSISVELLFDLADRTGNISLSIQQARDILPAPLLSLLKFMKHLTQPNLFELRLMGDIIGEKRPVPFESATVAGDLVSLVDKLDYVQRESATPFMVPEQFTALDVREIDEACRFFRGELIEITTGEISTGVHMNPEHQQAWDRWLESNDLMQIALVVNGHTFEIAGNEVPAGLALFHAAPVRIGNPDEMRTQKPWSEEESVKVKLEIVGDGKLQYRKVVGEAEDQAD